MSLVFATHNRSKASEVEKLIQNKLDILTLEDLKISCPIPETSDTIKGNALEKARFVYEKYGYNCFADDTGLEVDALNGAPGVYSARYAGEQKNDNDNIEKLLEEMTNARVRNARFKTVIALIMNWKEYIFEGSVEGEIIYEKRGIRGFGYDPVFKPKGYTKTFAEMSIEEKNKISHRAIAINRLAEFLKNVG